MSLETITTIADVVVAETREWQQRPLEEVYSVVFIDAIVVKMKKERIVQKAVLCGLTGVKHGWQEGMFWIYVSLEAESARNWGDGVGRTTEPGSERHSDSVCG